jgi:hypothetical protein
VESTHPSPDRQAEIDNRPRRHIWGLQFEDLPGWTFTLWVQPAGTYFVTAELGGRALDGDPAVAAADALNDARERAREYSELLVDLGVLVDAGLIAPVAP